MNRQTVLGAVAAGTLAFTALSGCSSSGKSSSSPSAGGGSSTDTSSASAANGKPIVIGVPESDNGNGFKDYYVGDGITAWAKTLNAAGGLSGRPIKIVRCNDQGTTAGATQCLRDQVQDKEMVVGTGFSPYASSITGPGFIKAGIPWLSVAGNSAADLDGTGATECIVPSAIGSYQALPEYAIKTLGLKNIAQIRLDVPQLDLTNREIQTSTATAGGKLVANLTVPLSAADFSAPVQQAMSAKADVIVLITTAPAVIKIIQTAASLGFTGTIAFGSGYYDQSLQEAITGVKSSKIKFISNADFPDYKGTSADVTAYREAMQKYDFSADLGNDQAASGWAAGQFLQKAFTTLGVDNINRSTVMNFLKTQTVPSVPLFTGPVGRANATTAFPGLGYAKTYIATVDANGRTIQPDTIDFAATTAMLSAK